MPTDGDLELDGDHVVRAAAWASGSAVGSAVGLARRSPSDSIVGVAVGDACAIGVGVAIGGRLGAGSAPRSSDADDNEGHPRHPQDDRERPRGETLHVPSLAARPMHRCRAPLALARDALAAEPAGLLTDFDGTLSPIVTDPAGPAGRRAPMARSRRSPSAWRWSPSSPAGCRSTRGALVGVPEVLIAGNHGTEWLEPGESQPSAAPGAEAIGRVLEEALARLPAMPGVVTEHKGVSASVHYRNAPDPRRRGRRSCRRWATSSDSACGSGTGG